MLIDSWLVHSNVLRADYYGHHSGIFMALRGEDKANKC